MSEYARRAIDVPATIVSIDEVQAEFDSWWSELGEENPAVRFALEIAVVEIATNIVEHTHRVEGSAGRRYELTLSADDEAVTAVFSDNGMPADIDLSTVAMADVDDESGRGLALAIAALDSLDYSREGGRNIWTLVCRR